MREKDENSWLATVLETEISSTCVNAAFYDRKPSPVHLFCRFRVFQSGVKPGKMGLQVMLFAPPNTVCPLPRSGSHRVDFGPQDCLCALENLSGVAHQIECSDRHAAPHGRPSHSRLRSGTWSVTSLALRQALNWNLDPAPTSDRGVGKGGFRRSLISFNSMLV